MPILRLPLTLFWISAAAGPQAPAAPELDPKWAAIVPGEMVVRFVDSSPIESLRAAAAKETTPDSPAHDRLAEALERSMAELGVPLAIRSLTSGGEVLLAIEREPLRRKLAELLSESPAILEVELEPEPRRIRPSATVSVRVLRVAPGVEGEALQAAIAELARRSGWPLQLVEAPDALRVTLDLRALTVAMVETTRARPDVRYAQPNGGATF